MLELLIILLFMSATNSNAAGIGGLNKPGKMEDLYALVNHCLTSNSNEERWVNYRPVSEADKKILKDVLDIDLTGFYHHISSYEIKHIIKKHGNVKTEADRGQIAVVPLDFLLLPLIVSTPDLVRISTEKTDTGLIAIEYQKVVEDKVFVFEEVRTKRKILAAKSFYKRKATR